MYGPSLPHHAILPANGTAPLNNTSRKSPAAYQWAGCCFGQSPQLVRPVFACADPRDLPPLVRCDGAMGRAGMQWTGWSDERNAGSRRSTQETAQRPTPDTQIVMATAHCPRPTAHGPVQAIPPNPPQSAATPLRGSVDSAGPHRWPGTATEDHT
jgi:hypothetical protein